MSQHDAEIRLRHMLSHAEEAISLVRGRTRADLDRDRLLNLALVRLVEIVGEAAKRVEADERRQCPGIPWKQVCGMRDRLIHGYDKVDFDILWSTIEIDFPALVSELHKGLGQSRGVDCAEGQ